MASYHGKILRINKDGSAPTDNPWYKANGSEASKRIYAKGVRNPFTMHIRKGTTDLYFNDVGSSDGNNGYKKWEEVNKCAFSLDTIGKNFGFNQGTFPSAEGVVDVTKPEFKGYANPIFAYLSSANGGTNISKGCAIVGGTFYEPSKPTFPSEYIGKYFFMDFCEGWINYMDADGKNVKSFGTGFAGGGSGFGSFCLEENIDGNLYHLVRSQKAGVSGLYRIKGPLVSATDAVMNENRYSFSVHPNPAHNQMNIHFNGLFTEQGVITVYDMIGKVQTTFNILAKPGFNDENYDISQLPRGIYNVNFSTPNAKASKKLVVE